MEGSGMNAPEGITIDHAGHLYVVDSSRVLGWQNADSFSSGQTADLVIGQPDFVSLGCGSDSSLCFPRGVAADSSDNLYVSDALAGQILEFDSPFDSCMSFPCALVAPGFRIGSADSCETLYTSASTLCGPMGLAIDRSDTLYVADYGDDRVLGFLNPARRRKRKVIEANRVFGERNFKTSRCNPGTRDICAPTSVAVDQRS